MNYLALSNKDEEQAEKKTYKNRRQNQNYSNAFTFLG